MTGGCPEDFSKLDEIGSTVNNSQQPNEEVRNYSPRQNGSSGPGPWILTAPCPECPEDLDGSWREFLQKQQLVVGRS